MYGKVHLFAGPAIVLGGIINGFTGFNFSGEPRNNIYYGAAVGLIMVVVLALLGWKRWSENKQMKGSGMSSHEELMPDSYRMDAGQRVANGHLR